MQPPTWKHPQTKQFDLDLPAKSENTTERKQIPQSLSRILTLKTLSKSKTKFNVKSSEASYSAFQNAALRENSAFSAYMKSAEKSLNVRNPKNVRDYNNMKLLASSSRKTMYEDTKASE